MKHTELYDGILKYVKSEGQKHFPNDNNVYPFIAGYLASELASILLNPNRITTSIEEWNIKIGGNV